MFRTGDECNVLRKNQFKYKTIRLKRTTRDCDFAPNIKQTCDQTAEAINEQLFSKTMLNVMGLSPQWSRIFLDWEFYKHSRT